MCNVLDYLKTLLDMRYEALKLGDYERAYSLDLQAQEAQRQLNLVQNQRIDNMNLLMVPSYYDEGFLKNLQAKPGSVIPYGDVVLVPQRYGDTTKQDGVLFIEPIATIRRAEEYYGQGYPDVQVSLRDGRVLSAHKVLAKALKLSVMNMVYVEGSEITAVYRHG